MSRIIVSTILTGLLFTSSSSPPWVRAGIHSNIPVWGLRGGILFGLAPAEFRPEGGAPRGLLRIAFPTLQNTNSNKTAESRPFDASYDLVNFIAVEPIVKNKRGYSELEPSAVDGKPGKFMLASGGDSSRTPNAPLDSGKLWSPAPGVEQLDVTIHVERFQNGAEVDLTISQRSDSPEEIEIAVRPRERSAPMEMCILTATMGNMARTRELWLSDGTARTAQLYPNFGGDGFAPHTTFPLSRLKVNKSGDVIAAVTNDENDPAAARPFPPGNHWYWGGAKITQY